MPQMSPMMWLLIMISSTIIYLMLMFKLYYINLNWLMNKNNKIKSNNLFLKLKW